MRESKTTDFLAPVEGIGEFIFGKRNLRDEVRASMELRRLTEGLECDEFTTTFCRALADLKVLTVKCPKGWEPDDLDDMDPFSEETYANVLLVWSALRDKEEPFRNPGKAVSEGGAKPSGDI
jgi:hypothetical protein